MSRRKVGKLNLGQADFNRWFRFGLLNRHRRRRRAHRRQVAEAEGLRTARNRVFNGLRCRRARCRHRRESRRRLCQGRCVRRGWSCGRQAKWSRTNTWTEHVLEQPHRWGTRPGVDKCLFVDGARRRRLGGGQWRLTAHDRRWRLRNWNWSDGRNRCTGQSRVSLLPVPAARWVACRYRIDANEWGRC